jgi:signal transduction histidine kinase
MSETAVNIEKLKAEIVELSTRLNASEALKSHFISNVANEIVNPFASILGLSTQIMQSESIDMKQIKHLASLIHTEAFHLDFQLRNIFAAAKIEAGQTEPEVRRFVVAEAISELVGLLKLEADKKSLTIAIEFAEGAAPDMKWTTDLIKLKLIVINFLHNAVKFSKKETQIKITIGIVAEKLTLSIRDNGIGIPQSQVDYIFDRFKTVGAGINTAYRGNGLGLSVNKSLLDIIGASIDLKTQEGVGTEFIIHIPMLTQSDEADMNDSEFLFDDELIF